MAAGEEGAARDASALVRRLLVTLVAVLATGAVGSTLATGRPYPEPSRLLDPFTLGSLACVFLVHATAWRSPSEVIATLAIAGSAGLVLTRGGAPAGLKERLTIAVTALGVASLLVLAWRIVRANGRDRDLLLARLTGALCLVAFTIATPPWLSLTAKLWPATADAYPYAVDATLGFQPSVAMGRFFSRYPLLAQSSAIAYGLIGLAFVGIFVLELRRGTARADDAVFAYLVLALAGYATYLVFPVAGPIFLFAGKYPHPMPDPALLMRATVLVRPVPRNCMPSLHAGWALLAWWRSRVFGLPARLAAGALLLLTLLATLGLGYHWAVDLVVAVPYVVAAQAACHVRAHRNGAGRTLGVATSVAVSWLLLVRFGPSLLAAIPGLTWLLFGATIVWGERTIRRLADPASVPTAPDLPGQAA